MAGDLDELLTEALRNRLNSRIEVRELARLSGGASRETWSFVLVDGDASTKLVLQRERPGGMRTSGGMATEVALLRAAMERGVPVPRLVASDDGRSDLDAPFMVLEHIDGETIARRILRDPELAGARRLLGRQLGIALARIHSIDVQSIPGLPDIDQVVQFRDLVDVLGEPHPTFELAFRWLEQNRPPRGRSTIVHGDYRLGNFIVGPEGLRAVLDWELAHVGDPIEDIGWVCAKAWRFGGEGRVAGLATLEDLLEGYAEESGCSVEADTVHWWEVLATLKWGVMCIVQASTHLHGLTRSVELAAIGRRTCETEHDLLELLP